jgi:hypothetical protein
MLEDGFLRRHRRLSKDTHSFVTTLVCLQLFPFLECLSILTGVFKNQGHCDITDLLVRDLHSQELLNFFVINIDMLFVMLAREEIIDSLLRTLLNIELDQVGLNKRYDIHN